MRKTLNVLRQATSLVLLAAIPALVLWRMWVVDSSIGSKYGCDGCYFGAVWQADGLFIALMALLLWLSILIRNRAVQVVLRLTTVVALFLFFLDLVIHKMFGIRILLADFRLYTQKADAVWEQTASFLGGNANAIVFFLLLFALTSLFLTAPREPWKATRIAAPLLVIAGIVLHFMPWQVDYVNNWRVRNFLVANTHAPEAELYSEDVAEKALAFPWPQQCMAGMNKRPDVILVIVESLSAYMSPVHGGHHKWTPKLDRLSSQAALYPSVTANGFSTTEGLTGILGGVRLVAPFTHQFGNVVSFQSAWGFDRPMPALFNQAGYHSAFLTTGPLSFSQKGEWAADLGFVEVEGNEAEFYRDWPRIHFGAASDEALYVRALKWLRKQPAEQNNFLVLETVSTHQPYTDPESGEQSLEKTVRFADKALASLIRRLTRRGWLQDNILIVVGDHRSMTPLDAIEFESFGRAAFSKVPLMIFGAVQPGLREGVYQLADLLPSLDYLISEQVCLHDYEANLFADGQPNHCTLHRRGAQRSMVDVICPEGEGLIELAGDETRFMEVDGLAEQRQQQVLALVARERLLGAQRHQRWLAAQQGDKP